MRRNVVSPFIQMIWEIVSDPDTDPVISWNQNGTSFIISHPETFTTDILAKHFKHTNVSSFVRQLNMYNFHKNKANTQALEFYHKLFRRDARELLIGIKRKPSQADTREGQELLRCFLARQENDSKKDQENDREEASEQTDHQLPYLISDRKHSAFTDQCERPQILLPDQIQIPTPKKILKIILIHKPMPMSPE